MTIAGMVVAWLEEHPDAPAREVERGLDGVPPWQWDSPYWPDLAKRCTSRLEPDLEAPRRGRMGALHVATMAPSDRCLQQSPDGRGAAWLLSGGSVTAYGRCCRGTCPRKDSERAA